MYGLFGRLLHPTVGLALFVAWAYADRWERRGLHERARNMRAAVVLAAIYPMFWALREVYRSLGGEALAYASLGCAVMVLFLLACSWVGKRTGGRGVC